MPQFHLLRAGDGVGKAQIFAGKLKTGRCKPKTISDSLGRRWRLDQQKQSRDYRKSAPGGHVASSMYSKRPQTSAKAPAVMTRELVHFSRPSMRV